MKIDLLAEFMSSPYGRRLLVHGAAGKLADHVRKAAVAAGVTLVEIDTKRTSIDALIERVESLDHSTKAAVIFIDHVERYRHVPRADWRIRGATQHARHLGIVMTLQNGIAWITDPRGAFYKQLSLHTVVPDERERTETSGRIRSILTSTKNRVEV